ncbi:hypothetical protein AHAS_Ahas02G0070900 [Arachis hypogaea]
MPLPPSELAAVDDGKPKPPPTKGVQAAVGVTAGEGSASLVGEIVENASGAELLAAVGFGLRRRGLCETFGLWNCVLRIWALKSRRVYLIVVVMFYIALDCYLLYPRLYLDIFFFSFCSLEEDHPLRQPRHNLSWTFHSSILRRRRPSIMSWRRHKTHQLMVEDAGMVEIAQHQWLQPQPRAQVAEIPQRPCPKMHHLLLIAPQSNQDKMMMMLVVSPTRVILQPVSMRDEQILVGYNRCVVIWIPFKSSFPDISDIKTRKAAFRLRDTGTRLIEVLIILGKLTGSPSKTAQTSTTVSQVMVVSCVVEMAKLVRSYCHIRASKVSCLTGRPIGLGTFPTLITHSELGMAIFFSTLSQSKAPNWRST